MTRLRTVVICVIAVGVVLTGVVYCLNRKDTLIVYLRPSHKNPCRPSISKDDVLEKQQKQKGLYENDKALIEAVRWYVSHGDKQIINAT